MQQGRNVEAARRALAARDGQPLALQLLLTRLAVRYLREGGADDFDITGPFSTPEAGGEPAGARCG
jgi:hypothetical protein